MGAIINLRNRQNRIFRLFKKEPYSFSSLVGICLFDENRILFSDSYLNKTFLLNEKERQLKELNSSYILLQPTGIAYSSVTKELWVVEIAGHRISILNEKGELIRRPGKKGKPRENLIIRLLYGSISSALYMLWIL